jgi:hypothetical protein
MKIKAKLLVIFLGVFLNSLSAQGTSDIFFNKADDFFKKNVLKGRVDYSSIKDNPSNLDKLIDIISISDLSKLQSENQEKAFLINVYNILIIKAVLNNYPLKSVMTLGGFFDKTIISISGENYSLNDIEKGLLFKNYPDPRLHFVLVCAAIGCPQIINDAYFPETLDEALDQRTRTTLNDTDYINIDATSKIVFVSELFNWYKKDFTENDLSIIQYINQYRDVKIPEKYSISFLTYDWSLNDIPSKRTGSFIPERDNLQAYTPSTLLKPGQIEIKFFNNLYTQTAYFDEESKKKELNERSTYYTGIINFLYGLSPNFNIGFDFFIKSVFIDPESGSPLKVFKFSSDANSRTSPTQFGPKLKFTPIESIRNLSIQTAFLVPLASNLDGGDKVDSPFLDVNGSQWWTQVFYDYLINNDFLLFLEGGLFFRFGSTYDDFLTPLKVFFNSFPSQKWTIYTMAEFSTFWKEGSVSAYYFQLGLGGKYQVTSNFELEILYTKFLFGKSQGAGETYNLGFRIII